MKVERRIKLFRNSVLAMLLLAGGAFAQQGPSTTVEVSPEFLASANTAFREVSLLRTAVAAQTKAIQAMEETDKAKDELIISERAVKAGLIRENEILKEQIEIYKKLTCDKTSLFWGVIKKTRCK